MEGMKNKEFPDWGHSWANTALCQGSDPMVEGEPEV